MASSLKKARTPVSGTVVIWPEGLRQRWGFSRPTFWRYERDGKLPPRDFRVGDKTGWRVETIEAAERAPVENDNAAR